MTPAPSLWTPLLIMQAVMAVACVLGFYSLCMLLAFVEVPEKNQPAMFTLVGISGSVGFTSIIGFLFGQAQSDANNRANNAKASFNVEPPATVTTTSKVT